MAYEIQGIDEMTITSMWILEGSYIYSFDFKVNMS